MSGLLHYVQVLIKITMHLHHYRIAIAPILLLFVLALPLSAQGPLMQKANQFVQEQKWGQAVESFKNVLKEEPGNTNAMFMLGYCLHSMGKYHEAIDAYSSLLEAIKPRISPIAFYNLACSHALIGNRDTALAYLIKAVNTGFGSEEQLRTDPDLASLRNDTLFGKAEQLLYARNHPCAASDNYHQLDFWVGSWEVRAAGSDTPVGTNNITRHQDDCVIYENWVDPTLTGISINTFDPQLKKWKQFWVDNKGNISEYTGELVDSIMVFNGTRTSSSGTVILSRMKLIPITKDHVRQYILLSTDNGATWQAATDLHYYRRLNSPPGSTANSSNG